MRPLSERTNMLPFFSHLWILKLHLGAGADERMEPEPRASALIVGPLSHDQIEISRMAVARTPVEPVVCADIAEAAHVLREASRPAPCSIFLSNQPEAEAFISWLRGEARLFSVPVVLLLSAPTDQAFRSAYAFGGDDAVAVADAGAITRRLANLSDFDPRARPPLFEKAVLAHPDLGRRRVIGRVLRQASFDVSFAADEEELLRMLGQSEAPPSLLVLAEQLQPQGALRTVTLARHASPGARLATIILAGATDAGLLLEHAAPLGSIAVASESAPADNLLFLANELLRVEVHESRASPRLLYAALCAFRTAGSFDPVYGLTYNVSREGMFVRTMDPPRRGAPIWLELRPPHGAGAVHLRATTVWCRGLRGSGGGASPPGFGLRLVETECPPPDLAAYHEAYDIIRAEPRAFA